MAAASPPLPSQDVKPSTFFEAFLMMNDSLMKILPHYTLRDALKDERRLEQSLSDSKLDHNSLKKRPSMKPVKNTSPACEEKKKKKKKKRNQY